MIGRMTPFTLAELTSIFGKSAQGSACAEAKPMMMVVATTTAHAASVGVKTARVDAA